MKHIIGVDIDGVLADFNHSFINLVVAETGRDLFPMRPFDIPCWDYPQHYGYTDVELARVWNLIEHSETFWSRLPPYPDAGHVGHAIDYLRGKELTGADVYFITSRPGLTAKVQTEHWLRRFGITLPTVLLSSSKGLCAQALRLTHYIDDRWENCLDVMQRSPRTRVYMMDRSWNWGANVADTSITRVFRVLGFLDAPVAATPPTSAH